MAGINLITEKSVGKISSPHWGKSQGLKMSKLSFRARQLDAYKTMPVYRSEEIPDVTDVAAINRAVPQMPTGMEKEEETVSQICRKIAPMHCRHLG